MPLLFLLLVLFFSPPSFAETVQESPSQVWKVYGRGWTLEREIEYEEWVDATVTEDFFIRHKIPVDCADVPYATRWIYARIAHLPAAATTRDGKLIGHWSTNWSQLPTHPVWHKDRRFRAALQHMLVETTTRTLPQDTYPIRIDSHSVTPGTAFFITESHAGIVGHVSLDGSFAHPIQTWEATVPAKMQKLNQKSFIAPRPESTVHSGLVKFRWPILDDRQWRYHPALLHPFYSSEQYSSAFYEGYADYIDAVARRIDPTTYDPWEKMLRVLATTTHYVQDRIPIVEAGYRQCQKGRCPEGSDLWEVHSTPGRDGMIVLLMDHLKQIIESNRFDHEVVKETMEKILFPISEDLSIDFYFLFQNYLWLSPRPEASIEARWGLRKCDLILDQIRSGYQSIRFIEERYRKRDPKYADYAIGQQREIIRRLNVEWDRSHCEDPDRIHSMRKKGNPRDEESVVDPPGLGRIPHPMLQQGID